MVLTKMREYLLSELPDFFRVTTRDGAPSDFCLRSEELNSTINLLDDDIYSTIADIIASRFPEWKEGFAAGAVFFGSAAGIRHSSQNAALANSLHPEGILQLGAGFCGQQSVCFDLLAERLSERYNKNIKVYSIGLRGHIAAAVRFDDSDDYIIFDPMLGLFYYSEDNSRFATLEEMRQNKDIAYRMDAYCSAHGHEFYYGIEHHVISPVCYSGRKMA